MTAAASMKLTINGLMGAQRGILSIYQTNKQTKNMKKKESLKKKETNPQTLQKKRKAAEHHGRTSSESYLCRDGDLSGKVQSLADW